MIIYIEFILTWEYFVDKPNTIERFYKFQLKGQKLVLVHYKEMDKSRPVRYSLLKEYDERLIATPHGRFNTITLDDIPFDETVQIFAKQHFCDSITVGKTI